MGLSLMDKIILFLGQFGAAIFGGAVWSGGLLTVECWGDESYWECVVGTTSGDLITDYHNSGYGKE